MSYSSHTTHHLSLLIIHYIETASGSTVAASNHVCRKEMTQFTSKFPPISTRCTYLPLPRLPPYAHMTVEHDTSITRPYEVCKTRISSILITTYLHSPCGSSSLRFFFLRLPKVRFSPSPNLRPTELFCFVSRSKSEYFIELLACDFKEFLADGLRSSCPALLVLR